MPRLKHIAAFLADAGGGVRGEKTDRCGGCCATGRQPVVEAEGPAARDRASATAEAATMETRALIDRILARYHAVHRREIATLVELAGRVEAAHRDHPEAPLGLAELLSRVRGEMEEHMKKEEEGLFPMILDGYTDLGPAIDIMRDDHDAHGERLRRLETLTRNHAPPGDACEGWRALYAGTRKFAEDLREHIDIENDVLFPRFADRE